MEENKNIESEEVEEIIDEDFEDIDKDKMKKNYIIVGILYLLVIILSVLLILGIKNQKDTVKDKIDDNKAVIENKEQNKKEETNESEESILPDLNSNIENSDEQLNILDQI